MEIVTFLFLLLLISVAIHPYHIYSDYYNDSCLRYSTATTEDFQAVCEAVSGMNLQKFFHQWIYEEYFTQYAYDWNWIQNGSAYDIQLEIQQLQDNHIFWMPIDVTITTAEGETTFVVWGSLQTQIFQLSVPSEPIVLKLDKYEWILRTVQEPFVDHPTFDQGILLVNGVSFSDYGSKIWDAYENRAFWGDYPISFWDCFVPPQHGYPSTLPEPLGHGRVPDDILGQFSTIIWIGNNYGGDLPCWEQTSIIPYLNAGGNILLMTRKGNDFINYQMERYLGISWRESLRDPIHNCISTYPGLQDMNLIGEQTLNAVFGTDLSNNESTLLFKDTVSFNYHRGLGVWRKPTTGGIHRSDGGQFVFISGRPYLFDPNQLRANVEFILKNFFLEQPSSHVYESDVNSFPTFYELQQNFPNPFNIRPLL